MTFIKKITEWVKKGVGRSVLLAVGLAAIYAGSISILITSTFSGVDNEEFASIYKEEIGCEIINYELSCNNSYYEDESIILDLSDNPVQSDPTRVILMKDSFSTGGQIITYKEVFSDFQVERTSFTYDDLVQLVKGFVPVVVAISFIVLFIGGFAGYAIINFLHAAIQKYLMEQSFGKKFEYKEMYGYSMFALIPFVIINGISRAIFDITPLSFITSFLHSFSLSLVAKIALFYLLHYVVVKFLIANAPVVEQEEEYDYRNSEDYRGV